MRRPRVIEMVQIALDRRELHLCFPHKSSSNGRKQYSQINQIIFSQHHNQSKSFTPTNHGRAKLCHWRVVYQASVFPPCSGESQFTADPCHHKHPGFTAYTQTELEDIWEAFLSNSNDWHFSLNNRGANLRTDISSQGVWRSLWVPNCCSDSQNVFFF